MGVAKYAQLQAVLEMARRYYSEALEARPVMANSAIVQQELIARMRDLEREVFACLFLNTQHQLIAFEVMFEGTLDKAPVYPREIAKRSLALNAKAVILAHNHPSGHCQPSAADKVITAEIQAALALLDINVLDHFIIAIGNSYSFAQTIIRRSYCHKSCRK